MTHIVGLLVTQLFLAASLFAADATKPNILLILADDNGPETTSIIHMRADYGHDGARPMALTLEK